MKEPQDKKPQDKINWIYALLGACFLFGYFYRNDTPVDDSDLKTKSITLSRDIEHVTGHRSNNSYDRLETNETQASFIIEEAGGIAANWTFRNLKKGDFLTLKYESARDVDLGNGANQIPVYFLQKGDKIYFDSTGYNQGKIIYNRRWGWIFLIGGALFILRGLTLTNQKVTWILGGISAAVILVLRFLNKF
jgi:hypothetical protein